MPRLSGLTTAYTGTLSEIAATAAVNVELGLDRALAATRLQELGPNSLPRGRVVGPLRLIAAQFKDLLVLLLLAAAAVSIAVGEPQDSVAILLIVVLNAALGATQTWRADKALAQLRTLATPPVRVRRGGAIETVPAETIVPGDVVLLGPGDLVPADLRVVESIGVAVDESALTGESIPVDKRPGVIAGDGGVPVGDRWNMLHRGCYLTRGRTIALTVATGAETEIGRIAALLAPEAPATPLQRRLTSLGRRLALVVIVICGILFVVGVTRAEPVVQVLLTAVSLAVAAIPEALPAIVSIALALGARRMSRRNALVRRLPAVETLGAVTCICTDKTGTLTRGQMAVGRYWIGGRDSAPGSAPNLDGLSRDLFRALALNNDSTEDARGVRIGDPTEIALAVAAAERGFVRPVLENAEPRVREFDFTADRSRMTTVHRSGTDLLVITKGSPEAVIGRCSAIASGGDRISPIDAVAAAHRFAADGFRVLAIAARRLDPGTELAGAEEVERALTLLGLVGLTDPPRPEVAGAIAQCRTAGISSVMITGDHPETAMSVARSIGLLEDGGGVLTGAEVALLDDAALATTVMKTRVFARVAPEQKLRIVESFQSRGELVAMTGDGINDAPALKRADIGVAMGQRGTDVARGASDMILLDDNFATIVAAVRAGRQIYDNIRRFVRFVLTGNVGEILTLMLAPLVGLPMPLLPIHILWINLATDGLPGIALAVEPAEPDVMRRPPRPPDENIFARGLGTHVMWVGVLIGAATLVGAAWSYRAGSTHWRTVAFTILAVSQLGHVIAVRSERESIGRIGWLSNLPLLAVVVASVAIQIAVLYLPPARALLRVDPLTPLELLVALALASLAFLGAEGEKWVFRRRAMKSASLISHAGLTERQ